MTALRDQLGTGLTIDNDANLAALGEFTDGAGQGVDAFVYLQIGTGVGLGLVINGRIYRGFTGAAGEVGYVPLAGGSTDAPRNTQRGMLEEALAADAVVRYAREAGMTGPMTAATVFAAARAGDPAARAAISREAEILAHLIASISAFLDPELIVVGGGVGQNLDLLKPALTATLARITPLQPAVAAGALATEAVLRGGVATGITIAREAAFTARIGPGAGTGRARFES